MATHPNELSIPPEAAGDSQSGELLRAWVGGGTLHVSLKPTVWADPGNWGVCLADVARHVARAMQQDTGCNPLDTLQRITAAFNCEMEAPTAKPEGGFEREQ